MAGSEDVDQRTDRSKTSATGKPGEYTTEFYAEPVHYKDGAGKWQDIKTDLNASAGGRRRNSANAFSVEIADSSADPHLALLGLDADHSVAFSLEGATKSTAKADKTTSTYTGVRKDTDLRLISQPKGVREELVLRSKAAPDRFVFPLELKGLTASIDATGDVVYRDSAGVERARTPHGSMSGAKVDPRSGEAPTSDGVTYALIPNGDGVALEVRLDRAWLDDPARAYPVVVDPDLANATLADDTFVLSGVVANNSSSTEIKVGTYNGGGQVARGYLHFDTSALTYKTINWAAVLINESWSYNCATAPGPIYRVTAPWSGSDQWPGTPVDPNPIAGGVFAGTNACPNRNVIWEVTPTVAGWASSPSTNYGLSLRASETDSNGWKKYASSETGGPPALHVTWSEPPTGNPIGYLDSVTPFVGGVWPQGWAIDPNTGDSIQVHVYADNNFVEALTANTSRPDVGAAYPGYGNNHGISGFVALSPGYHWVCIYAINVGPGNSNPVIGCQGATVPSRGPAEPFGSFDTAAASPGAIFAHGWAIDADTTAPITVQFWADTNYVSTLTANTNRPDVGPFGYGNNHGFDDYVYLTPGYHNVCAFAINTGGGSSNPLLGCRQVTIAAMTAPSAPTNVVASLNADKSIKVNWTPSASNGGSPIDFYAIYAYDAATSTYLNIYNVVYTATCGQACNTTTFAGLAVDKSYLFVAYAHNGAPANNGFSSPGISNTVVIPPNVTTTTTVPATTTTVPAATTTVPATTSTSTTSTSTSTTSTTVPAPRPPGPPTSVTVSPGDGQATVSWAAPQGAQLNGSTLTGFTVTVTPDCACAVPHTSNPLDTSLIVTGLTNGIPYTFQVRAESSAGAGAQSTPPVGATTYSLAAPTRVMTWNLHRGFDNNHPDVLAAPIAASGAKIVGLQEVTADMANGIAESLGWPAAYYRESDAAPCPVPPVPTVQSCAAYGDAILSAYPLSNTTSWELAAASGEGRLTRNELRATLTLPSGEVLHVYNTHTASPDMSTSEERAGQAGEVRTHVQLDAANDPDFRAVVTGDFNSGPTDPAIADQMTTFFTDSWPSVHGADPGLTGCFDDALSPPPPRCRYDYVFLWKDAGLVAQSAVIGGTRDLSDHYYLAVDVR